jgi:predicted TIM-barrel fold metal-dependent hydrolase
MTKIWADSGDSHVLEPTDLFTTRLPQHMRDLAPRTEVVDHREILYVDGKVMHRDLMDVIPVRPPGAFDVRQRLVDLDDQGIYREVVFPSLGLWVTVMSNLELQSACVRIYNDWCHENINQVSPRFLGVGVLPLLDIEASVREVERLADLGFRAVLLPGEPTEGFPYNKNDHWEPLWSAVAASGMALTSHIGTGPAPLTTASGPGGALINYVTIAMPMQRVVADLVSCGAFERHPRLRLLLAESGAAWLPSLADRMDEAFRQHGKWVRPKLSETPGTYIRRQVYASFQHDENAVPVAASTGFHNILWGSDYPHLEGTFPHSQQVLHHLLDGADPELSRRIRTGAFAELFGVDAPIDDTFVPA